jgi:fatty-acyl-CoA synthase
MGWPLCKRGCSMTAGQLYQHSTLSDLLDYATIAYESRIFLDHRDKKITYRELRRETAALAEAFVQLGLKRGQGLAFLSSDRADTLISREAAVLKGLYYVALNPHLPLAQHVSLIRDFGVAAVIIDDCEYPEAVTELARALPDLQVLGLGERADGSGLSSLAEPHVGAKFRVEAQPGDLVRIAQTGGTTGRPKGIMLSHRSWLNFFLMCNATWDLPTDMRFLATTPLSHAAGTYVPFILARGGSFYSLQKFSPLSFQAAVARHRITCTMLVPTQMKRILQNTEVDPAIIGGIETIAYGTAPIAPSVLEEWIRRFGPNISQFYGQTESPMCATTLPKSCHDLGRPERLASCGLANIGVQMAVLRTDGSRAESGETGELVTRNPCIMDGYWNLPDETAAAFAGDWLHTGDLGYQDTDGFYYIVGRLKDVIISGGFNIYPKEVEDVIATHPSVLEVAVIGVPDEEWGEAVKALVVLRPGSGLDESGIIALVKREKGSVAAPKSVNAIDAIPMTAIGKPDKNALRQTFWSGRRGTV